MGWIIDPTGEATGTQLDITDGTTYSLIAQDAPPPELRQNFATSVDMSGARMTSQDHENRTITLRLWVTGASQSALETAIQDLQQKVSKINRDAVVGGTGFGGTLKYTSPTTDTLVFDVISAKVDTEMGWQHTHTNTTTTTLTFLCGPYGRGASVQQSDNTETTNPCLVFTHASLGGDMPALGSLQIDNDDATYDQLTVVWGLQSKNYDSAATASLFYEAESRTPVAAGAATAVGPSGASGAGSNTILANALQTSWQQIVSGQASGGGAYLTHVGGFRVFARCQAASANTGTVSVRAEWCGADLRGFSTGSSVDLTNGQWVLADLGVVRAVRSGSGTHRWDVRIAAKSTVANEDVYVDCFMLVPIDEGSGVASVSRTTNTATQTAQDTFGQTAGNLDTKTLTEQGGTWTEKTAGQFTIDTTNARTQRTTVSDAAGLTNGKYAHVSGTAGQAGSYCQVDCYHSNALGSSAQTGVMLRWVDASNHLLITIKPAIASTSRLSIDQIVAGTTTNLASVTGISGLSTGRMTVYGEALANGYCRAVLFLDGNYLASTEATSAALVTGGALATGRCGIFDYQSSAIANTRGFDNFYAGTQTSDAAAFASKSLVVTNSGPARQDSATSTAWTRPSSYVGDYLTVPIAGKESRTTRFIVKGSRAKLNSGGDAGVDDISARLTVTPRYLQLPS